MTLLSGFYFITCVCPYGTLHRLLQVLRSAPSCKGYTCDIVCVAAERQPHPLELGVEQMSTDRRHERPPAESLDGDVSPVGVIDAAEALVGLQTSPSKQGPPPAAGASAGVEHQMHCLLRGASTGMRAADVFGLPGTSSTSSALHSTHVVPMLDPHLPAPFPRWGIQSVTPAQLEQQIAPPPLPASAPPALALYHASAARLGKVNASPANAAPGLGQGDGLAAPHLPNLNSFERATVHSFDPAATASVGSNRLLQQWHAAGRITTVPNPKRSKMR